MKKIIVFAIFLASLVSCTNFMSGEEEFLKTIAIEPKNEFSSYQEAGAWIVENVKYIDRSGTEWQSPYQTETKKTGICVDFCFLAAYYADALGHSVIIRGVRDKSKEYPHMIIVLDGVEFEPQTNLKSEYEYDYIVEEFTLAQAMAKCLLVDGNRAAVSNYVYK